MVTELPISCTTSSMAISWLAAPQQQFIVPNEPFRPLSQSYACKLIFICQNLMNACSGNVLSRHPQHRLHFYYEVRRCHNPSVCSIAHSLEHVRNVRPALLGTRPVPSSRALESWSGPRPPLLGAAVTFTGRPARPGVITHQRSSPTPPARANSLVQHCSTIPRTKCRTRVQFLCSNTVPFCLYG
jgi:hypothetical protein